METSFKVDLTNCDKEPIHIPGSIQSHGFLLAIDPGSLNIINVSENVVEFCGTPPPALLGQHLSTLNIDKNPDGSSSLIDVVQLSKHSDNFENLNPHHVSIYGKKFFAIAHKHAGKIILEFEPIQKEADSITLQKTMSQSLAVIQSADTNKELLDNVASLIKDISGYNRIMIYKFHKDHHGEVVAEAIDAGRDSWLRLHYPASDIPAQARELYKLNLVRLISDVNSKTSGLLSANGDGAPLDLTHSTLRAVSPIHIEYLQNMGVGASFSISLVSKGELWGLIACHNDAPKFIDYHSRMACKFIGQLFSAALDFKSNEELDERNNYFKEQQALLHAQVMKDLNLVQGLIEQRVNLLSINKASGAIFCFEGKTYLLGIVPSGKELAEIINWLQQSGMRSFYQTTSFPSELEFARSFADKASGIMAAEIAPNWSEYIIWVKPEVSKTVDWAGDQNKNITKAEDGSIRLSPRKSFAKWTEEVKYTSEGWSGYELATAMRLREDVIQTINKRTNEIRKLNELLKQAYDELDTFSFTISHDLRTPLSSIKNYSEIILEDHSHELSEDVRRMFNKVVQGTNKMAGLIQDVLQYTRVGRTQLEFVQLNMRHMLNEIKEEVLSNYTGLEIKFEIGETPPVQGDKTMIWQLFTNLISNAVKYSIVKKGAKVLVNGTIDGEFTIYKIADNGVGLDMKYTSRIFELFQRLDNVQSIQGTGVGLAIAKRIVEKHEGKIWVESELDNGTEFYIALPIKESQNV